MSAWLEDTMYESKATPRVAAQHLLALLGVTAGSVSISSFKKEGNGTALRVFITPKMKHLKSRIPDFWEGYPVTCEIAEAPRAQI